MGGMGLGASPCGQTRGARKDWIDADWRRGVDKVVAEFARRRDKNKFNEEIIWVKASPSERRGD